MAKHLQHQPKKRGCALFRECSLYPTYTVNILLLRACIRESQSCMHISNILPTWGQTRMLTPHIDYLGVSGITITPAQQTCYRSYMHPIFISGKCSITHRLPTGTIMLLLTASLLPSKQVQTNCLHYVGILLYFNISSIANLHYAK